MGIINKKLLSKTFENLEDPDLNEDVEYEEINTNNSEVLVEDFGDVIETLQTSKDRLERVYEEQEANIQTIESGEEVEGSTISLPDQSLPEEEQISEFSNELSEVAHKEELTLENISGQMNFESLDEMFKKFGSKRDKVSVSKEAYGNAKILIKERFELYKATHESVGESIKNIGKAIWEAIKKAFEALKDFIFSVFNKVKKLPNLVKSLIGKTDSLSGIMLDDFFKKPDTAGYSSVFSLVLSNDSLRTMTDLKYLSMSIGTILLRMKNRLDSLDEEFLKYMSDLINHAKEKKIKTDLADGLVEYVESKGSFDKDSYLFFGEKDRIVSVCIGDERGFYTSKYGHHDIKRPIGISKSKVRFTSDDDEEEYITEINVKLNVEVIPLDGKVKNFIEDYLKSKYDNLKDLSDDFLKEVNNNMKDYMSLLESIKNFEKTSKEVLNTINDIVKSNIEPEKFKKAQVNINRMSRDFMGISKTATKLLVGVTSGVAVLGKYINLNGRMPG